MINKIIVLLFCLVTSQALIAKNIKEVLGVSLAYQITLPTSNEKLDLNGHAVVSNWGEQAYVAALYTIKNEKRAEMLLVNDQPMAMLYYFVHDDISAQMLITMLTESISVNNSDSENKQLVARIVELKQALNRNFNAGDTLAFYYSPNNGLSMMINSEMVQHWPHAKSFFNMLLRTWVGPYPPSRGFKRAILNFPTRY